MAELTQIIKQNCPFVFEGLDMRPGFRANDAGVHTYSVNIMVTEQQWNALKTIPRHKMIAGMLYWYEDETDVNPDELVTELAQVVEDAETAGQKKEKPKKEKKGPYGQFWRFMHRPDQVGANFTTYPDLKELLDVDAEHVHGALKKRLDVDSLTFVSPRQFEKFVEENGLSAGLITMSRNAEKRAAEVGN